MVRTIFKIIPVMLIVLGAISDAAAEQKVVISSVIYPPLVFKLNDQVKEEGMLREIASKAYQASGYKANYELIPMSRNVWSIDKRMADACLGAMEWFRRQGKEDLVSHVDLVNLKFVAFYRKSRFPDGIEFKALSDLRGYTFGNVRGSSSQHILESAGLRIDLVKNVKLNFKKLEADRFDFAVAFRITGTYLAGVMFQGKEDQFAYIDKHLLDMPLSMIFLKQNKFMKKKFEKGLMKIVRDGTYYSILEKYYGKGKVPDDIIPEQLKRYL